MQALELRLPPPVLALLLALAMGLVAWATPVPELEWLPRAVAAGGLLLLALVCGAGAVLAFRRARTTVDPTRPERASVLVTSGIFRLTRNPMYVALALILCALAVFLARPWLMVGPLVFVGWISRFQIMPEERVLAQKFGAEYEAYRARVRRWV